MENNRENLEREFDKRVNICYDCYTENLKRIGYCSEINELLTVCPKCGRRENFTIEDGKFEIAYPF